MTATSPPDVGPALGPVAAIALFVATLAAANVARSTVIPTGWHLAFNLAIGITALGIGITAGLGATDLGMGRADVVAGARLGAVAFTVISVVVVAVGLAGLLTDDRADVSWSAMLLRALVVIPLGTVLVEEVAFRGVLHGLLVRTTSATGALLIGALLFGLWHVFPAWRGGAVDTDVAEVGRVATVAATFAATAVAGAAGAALVWLRARSGSVVAPMLAHLATNSVTFAVAWAVR